MEKEKSIVVLCPHCKEAMPIDLREMYRAVFRHAFYKTNRKPVPSDMPQKQCLELLKRNQAIGCCKLFLICKLPDESVSIIKCDYLPNMPENV